MLGHTRKGYDPYNSLDVIRKRIRAIWFKAYFNGLYGKFITTRNHMKKGDEIAQPNSCLNKAAEDEPVFVLRAKDPIAPAAVEEWARLAQATGRHEPEKIEEARALAQAMREWRTDHVVSNRTHAQAEAANRFEG